MRDSNSLRSGLLLLELAGYLVVTVSLLSTAGVLLAGMLRGRSAHGEGLRCDLACERLRRDLATGATMDGESLRAGPARWTVGDGQLQRNGTPLVAVAATAWKRSADGWTIIITPRHGTPRTISSAGGAP